MVGHIADVVPSDEYAGRWLVVFDRYAEVDVPDAWKGWRNPVRYEDSAPFDLQGFDYKPMPEPDSSTAAPMIAGVTKGLTIEQAKRGLAATFGVKPELVEITIRG